jgi:hypothetical protein
MPLTPSKRHANWQGTSFTPVVNGTAGSATPITGVMRIAINLRGELIQHKGDADYYPTVNAGVGANPQAMVVYRDLKVAHGLNPGNRGTLTSTHNDAKNAGGVGGGSYSFTMTYVVESTETEGQHAQFGEATTTFVGESTDGVTNPITYTDN